MRTGEGSKWWKDAPINSVSQFARHSCSLRPTYQGIHVACLRERSDGVPSEVFDQCYPGWIMTRIRCDGSQEQGKLVGIRECRCRRAKRHLNHVPIGDNFGQCLGHFRTSSAEQEWHELLLPRRVQGVKESIYSHSRIALKTEKWKFRYRQTREVRGSNTKNNFDIEIKN